MKGSITGSGGLTIAPGDFIDINGGQNSFTGLTDVLAGAKLYLSNLGNTSISGDLTIENNGSIDDQISGQLSSTTVLTLNGNAQFIYDVIQGSISDTIAGLQGSSPNSAILAEDSAAGPSQLTTLTLDGTGTYIYAGQISDNGGFGNAPLTLIKDGSGTQILTGTNTYTGGTTLAGGILQVGGTTALGTGTVSFTGGTLQYGTGITQDFSSQFSNAASQLYSIDTNGNNVTFATALTSSGGSLTKLGAGTLTLTAANTYSGTTTISAGTLTFTGDTSGLGGAIIDNAALVFNQSANSSFSNGISGSGSLTKQGAGNLTLGNANTYGGTTTVSAGTLTFTGDTSGLGGNLVDNATVIFNQSANSSFSQGISGSGSLTKQGAGMLTLSGNNSSYTGVTTISAGTLVAANPNALGVGVVNQGGGTLETDNVNHVITMGSGFNQTAGTLVLNLNGSPGAASNDVVHVTGSATLGGNLSISYAAGSIAPLQSEKYTVITTTTGITSVNAAGYEPPALQAGALRILISGEVVGDDFDVTLTGKQTGFTALVGTSFTGNQYSVASYLDRFDGGATLPGPIISLLQALDGISVNPSALGPYFDQLTPLKFESFTSSTAFNNASFSTAALDSYLANHRGPDGTFVSSVGGIDYSGLAVTDPNVDPGLQGVHSRLLAWNPPPSTGLISDTPVMDISGVDMKDTKNMIETGEVPANLWNVFISGNVVLAQDFSDPSAGTSHTDATTGAVQAGVDYKITPHFLVGAMFAYGHTDATLDTLGSTASVDTYSPGVYASYSNKGWYANALGSYGFANYDQNRKVAIGAFNGTANSSPGGDQIVGNLDGGYDFHRGPWTFGPTLGTQYVHLDVDGFTETGLPGADLTVNQNESDSLRSSLGGRIAYAVQDGNMTFTPHLSTSWQHEFLDESRGITSQFNGVGAGSFVVKTPNPSRESALVDIGFDAQVNKALTVFTDYTVQAGQSNYFGQSVQAGVKIGF